MISNYFARLSLVATLLVLVSPTAQAGIVKYTWTSGGVKYSCSVTPVPNVYRCVSTNGKVVYVNATEPEVKLTGDTEPGCRPHGIVRVPQTQCYQDVRANPEVEISQLKADEILMREQAEKEAAVSEEQRKEAAAWEDQKAEETAEEAADVSEDEKAEEGVEVSEERKDSRWEELTEEPEFVSVPCDDGQKEGDINWLEWLYAWL